MAATDRSASILALRFPVAAPAQRVFEALADPGRFAEAHPLIVAMTPTGSGRYRVRERVARGPLPLHFTYPAWIAEDPEARTLRIRVRIWRLIHVDMTFRVILDEGGVGCVVEEQVSFRSILPVRRTLEAVFREEHARLFRNLEAGLRTG